MLHGERHVSTLSHPGLIMQRNTQAVARSRQIYVVEGISGSKRSLTCNDPDINTLNTALLERVFYHKVDGEYRLVENPDKKVVYGRLREFRSRLLRWVGSASPVSPEQFAEMYTGRKRTIYERAVEDYTVNGVRRRDAYSDSFVKCEKVPGDKAPRCIQPRRPVYNVGVGRYLKPVEHKIYKGIQHVFGSDTPVVLKGFNAVETADIIRQKWEQFEKPVALGLDASRFDQHVSAEMLEWEHSIYNSMFRSPELRKLLRWQIDNEGFGRCDDGTLRYKVRGKRFSGDMNTALGNCLIMCAMIYAYGQDRGVSIELVNNGDDCVVFMEARDLVKFGVGLDEWFDEMGFVMTKEDPVYELHQIEFCQCKPVVGLNGLIMCRNFEKAREKDTMCLFDISTPSAARKWLGAVGECGLSLTAGIPVFQEMYKAYIRHGEASDIKASVGWECGMTHMARGLHPKEGPVSDDARYSFYVAFGVTPDEQEALEEYYRSWSFSAVVEHREVGTVGTAPF